MQTPESEGSTTHAVESHADQQSRDEFEESQPDRGNAVPRTQSSTVKGPPVARQATNQHGSGNDASYPEEATVTLTGNRVLPIAETSNSAGTTSSQAFKAVPEETTIETFTTSHSPMATELPWRQCMLPPTAQRWLSEHEQAWRASRGVAIPTKVTIKSMISQQKMLAKTTGSLLHKSHANNKRTTADLPGSLTSTNEPAAAAPLSAASPTTEDATGQLPGVDNRAPPTQYPVFKLLESYIPFGYNQEPSQTQHTKRKQTAYRPSTSSPRSSAQPLIRAAESAAVAAAHDQKRCVMGDRMVYCKTCGQHHCCELPY